MVRRFTPGPVINLPCVTLLDFCHVYKNKCYDGVFVAVGSGP